MSNLIPSHPPEPMEPWRASAVDPEAQGAEGRADDLREMLGLFRRNLWIILGVTVLTTALATAYAYTRAPSFASVVAIRLADVRRSLTGGIEEQGMERFIGSATDPVLSQIQVLRSRTLIGRAVDESGERLRPIDFSYALLQDVSVAPEAATDTLSLRFEAGEYRVRGRAGEVQARYGEPISIGGVRFTVARRPGDASGSMAVLRRERAVAAVLAGLSAKPRERTDVVDVRFESGDPVLAQHTLNAVAATFQTVNAERARLQSRRRRLFLEEQLQTTDSLLAMAQLDVSRFRERERAYSTRDRFVAQQQSLMSLDIRREELAAERDVYRNLIAAVSGSRANDAGAFRALVANPGLAANPAIGQLSNQLLRYETALDSLRSGEFPRSAQDPDVQRLESLLGSTRSRTVETARSHVASLDVRLAALDDLRGRHVADMQSMPDTEAEEVRLAQVVTTIQAMADQLRQDYQRARIAEAVEAGQVEILDPAGPAVPLPSRRGLIILAGLVAGLTLGTGVSIVREQLNTSLRRREDVERLLGLPSLTVVPRITPAGGRVPRLGARANGTAVAAAGGIDPMLVAISRPRSTGAEAYRTLRTNVIFSQAAQKLRVLAVTSAGPAEGKSTTSANVAAVFAQQGLRVLLVDCDLRRPRLHEVFSIPREPGFTQYLLGHAPLDELVQHTSVPTLHVLAAGTLPPNPAELLGSPRGREVIRLFADQYDLVVVDTPPILLASDAAILGSLVDGMLLVVRAGQTARHAAQQAVRQIEAVGGRVLGVVLNDPDAKIPKYEGYYGYGYGYNAYYGEEDAVERTPAEMARS